jgi:hypothetical protein
MTNANGSQNAHTFPTLSMAGEAMSQTPPTFPTSNGSKRMAHAKNSKKCELDTKWFQVFYEANIFINIFWHLTFIDVVKVTNDAKILNQPPTHHA